MLAHENAWKYTNLLHEHFQNFVKCGCHTDDQVQPRQRKSAITGDMALTTIIAGSPWLIQRIRIEYRAAFVERFLLKRARGNSKPHPDGIDMRVTWQLLLEENAPPH